MFEDIEKAKTAQKLPYVTPGKYILKIDALLAYENRKRVPFTKGEFTVVQRLTPTGNEVGTRCSLSINMTNDKAMANVHNMFEAALRGEAVTKQKAEALVSEKQPAKGVLVEVEAFDIIKKSDGKPFTLVNFHPHTGK